MDIRNLDVNTVIPEAQKILMPGGGLKQSCAHLAIEFRVQILTANRNPNPESLQNQREVGQRDVSGLRVSWPGGVLHVRLV